RVKEDDFDIKNDEDQRNQVVAEVELDPGIAFGLDPTLIDVLLHCVGRVGPDVQLAKQEGDPERQRWKQKSEAEEDSGSSELVQHGALSRVQSSDCELRSEERR